MRCAPWVKWLVGGRKKETNHKTLIHFEGNIKIETKDKWRTRDLKEVKWRGGEGGLKTQEANRRHVGVCESGAPSPRPLWCSYSGRQDWCRRPFSAWLPAGPCFGLLLLLICTFFFSILLLFFLFPTKRRLPIVVRHSHPQQQQPSARSFFWSNESKRRPSSRLRLCGPFIRSVLLIMFKQFCNSQSCLLVSAATIFFFFFSLPQLPIVRLSEFIFPFPVFPPSDKRQTKVSQHFCSASKLCIFCTLIRFIFKVLFLPIQLHPRELQVPCFHSLFLFALAHRLLRARLRRYDVTVSSLSIKANCKLSCFFSR